MPLKADHAGPGSPRRTRDETKRGHPSSAWLTRLLLVIAIAIITAFCLRFTFSNGITRWNLFDSTLVNLAVISTLFTLSVLALQNALKNAARDELDSLLTDLIDREIKPSLEVFYAPFTRDTRLETSIVVARNFQAISNLFINELSNVSYRDEIVILNTWIPQLLDRSGTGRRGEFCDALLQALKRGARMKILMIFPYSHAAILRSESVSQDPDSHDQAFVEYSVKRCLNALNEIANDLAETSQTNNLTVRLYSTLPSMSAYCASNISIIGSYFHAKLAIEGPQLILRNLPSVPSEQLIRNTYHHEIEAIWTSPSTVDFKLSIQGGSRDVLRQLDTLRGLDPFPDQPTRL